MKNVTTTTNTLVLLGIILKIKVKIELTKIKKRNAFWFKNIPFYWINHLLVTKIADLINKNSSISLLVFLILIFDWLLPWIIMNYVFFKEIFFNSSSQRKMSTFWFSWQFQLRRIFNLAFKTFLGFSKLKLLCTFLNNFGCKCPQSL